MRAGIERDMRPGGDLGARGGGDEGGRKRTGRRYIEAGVMARVLGGKGGLFCVFLFGLYCDGRGRME